VLTLRPLQEGVAPVSTQNTETGAKMNRLLVPVTKSETSVINKALFFYCKKKRRKDHILLVAD